MKNILFASVAAAAIAGFTFAAPVAHADTFQNVTNASVTIWHFTNPSTAKKNTVRELDPSQQALPGNPEATSANQVYTGSYTGPIDFSVGSSGTNTIRHFLNTAGGTFIGPISGLTQKISIGSFTQTTLMDFQFSLTDNETGGIRHDDGISVWDASNTTKLIDDSAPTSAATTNFTLSAGTYNLWYVEANGLPAILRMSVTSSTPVPEPGSLALLGTALLGLGLIGWTTKKRHIA